MKYYNIIELRGNNTTGEQNACHDKTKYPARHEITTRCISNWVRIVLMRCSEINGIYSNNAIVITMKMQLRPKGKMAVMFDDNRKY